MSGILCQASMPDEFFQDDTQCQTYMMPDWAMKITDGAQTETVQCQTRMTDDDVAIYVFATLQYQNKNLFLSQLIIQRIR